MEVQGLNHGTAREVPNFTNLGSLFYYGINKETLVFVNNYIPKIYCR